MSELVSVVIPCYNAGRYLRECLDSVLSQTYSNIEIIVVNDGSIDDSAQVLDEYSAKVKILEHEGGRNRGAYASLNLGVRNATGDWIAFLDADDFWYPEKIAKQVAFMQQHGAKFSYTATIGTRENGEYDFVHNSIDDKCATCNSIF